MMNRKLNILLVSMLILCLSGYAISCTNNKAHNATIEDVIAGNAYIDTVKSDMAGKTGSGTESSQEWPCFHGKDRTNKSDETGLLSSWPEGGPKLLLTISGLGEGYSTVSIADDMIFTSGTFDNQTYVYAFDLAGNQKWKKSNGSAWKVEVSWARGYNGPRSTPTYDNGLVYHLSELNKLTAYNAKNGDVVWTRDLLKEFEAGMPDYGFTESVLIENEKLFVKPAGKKGYMACLNKTTGETIWINKEIKGEYAYDSPVLQNIGENHQVISASSSGYYGIDTETGRLLWTIDIPNIHQLKCTDAIAIDDQVFITSGLGGGSMLLKLKTNGKDFDTETIWKTDLMDNYHGGVIYHKGYFYGSGDRSRGWYSIDGKTGKQMWKYPGGQGSLTFAEEMLYLLDERGTMRLVKATPESFHVNGEFKVASGGKGPYWAHPVICGGRLYLRHDDKVFVYDISSQ